MEVCFRVDPGKIIVVYPEEGHGAGDYSTACKVASNFFIKEGIPKEQIVLAARYPERFGPFNDLEFEVIDRGTLFYDKINSVALLVLAPLTTPYFPIPSFPSSVGLFEYGFTDELKEKKPLSNYISSASFGLLEDQVGIMIDPLLNEWKMSGIMKNPYKRIGLLEKLPIGLQQAILGDFLSEEVIHEFCQKKKLYLGYAHYMEAQESFLKAVFEFSNKHFPVLVLPNCKYELLSPDVRDYLEIIAYDMRKDTCTILQSPREIRGRLIIGDLFNPAFKVIMAASEQQTLTTGDSSAAEAVSAGKLAFYEMSSHKREFSRGLLQKYGKQILVFEARRRFPKEAAREIFEESESDEEDLSCIDAWPKIRALCLDVIEKAEKTTMPTRFPGHEKMQFDIPYIILPSEMAELLINEETGASSLPELSDSIFSFTLSTLSHPSVYLIIRQKK